jgi:RNA polymerase sigma factor (TIGR02999 family)
MDRTGPGSERHDAPGGGSGDAPGEVTRLLQAAQAGDAAALDRLFACAYAELRRLAHRVRAGRAGETLNTTALVHEAYLKLVPSADRSWEGRAHFFGVAARAMRQVLVDAARHRDAKKRGEGAALVTLDDHALAQPVRAEEVIALDEALERLAALDERWVRVVEQRFFAGLTAAETAAVLGVSVPTVERAWRAARAWLTRELAASGRATSGSAS